MKEIIVRPDEPIDVLQWSGESLVAKERATKLTITTSAEEGVAVDLLKQIKESAKEAEIIRKAKKEPFLEMGKRIDAAFKPITDSLSEAENIVKRKLNDYLQKIEQERREAEAKMLKEFEKSQAQAAEERAFGGGESVAMPVPEIVLPKTQAVGSYAKASQVSVWRWEIVDAKKIPSEYLIVDEKKVNAMVRAGSRSIPGFRIFEDKTISVR